MDPESPAPEPDGIAAAALASVLACAADPSNPAWERWVSGPVTKPVRRADARTHAKTATAHPEAIEATHGRAAAMALPPLPMDALPTTLARLQVSGTELPASAATAGAGALIRDAGHTEIAPGPATAHVEFR